MSHLLWWRPSQECADPRTSTWFRTTRTRTSSQRTGKSEQLEMHQRETTAAETVLPPKSLKRLIGHFQPFISNWICTSNFPLKLTKCEFCAAAMLIVGNVYCMNEWMGVCARTEQNTSRSAWLFTKYFMNKNHSVDVFFVSWRPD